MSSVQTSVPTVRKPLRIWPGVAIAIVSVIARYVFPLIGEDVELYSLSLGIIAVFASLLCAVAIVVWWLFFSRAYWPERAAAIILMTVAFFVTRRVVDESIAGGMMGMLLFIYLVPILSLALVVWAAATRRLSDCVRRASLVATILLACLPWALLRTAGSFGAGSRVPLALDADSGATAPGPGRRGRRCRLRHASSSPRAQSSDTARNARRRRNRRRSRQSPELPGKPAARAADTAERESRSCGLPRTRRDPPSRVAGLSRTRSRQRHSRRANQHRLVGIAAGRDVAPADRTRLVVVCGPAAIFSTPRSSAATTRSSPATECRPASRCGGTATRSASGSRTAAPVRARRRHSATVASTRLVRPGS